jgi:SNF2 family DNA or RNA helicase
MSYTLFNHQKDILALLTEHDRFMLLAEQGVGKTLVTLVHLSNLILAGEVTTALIIAPLSGIGAWRRDIEKFPPERRAALRKAIVLCNYDKLSRKGSKYQKQMWQSWDFIVLDESHAIKNPSSNRTQYFIGKGKALGLVSKAKYVYLLTGTLITNSHLEDAWAPLRAVLGDDWLSWPDFKRQYLVTKNLPGSYAEIIVGYRHRAELLALAAQYSYRVLKKDCLDLPRVQDDEVVLVPFADGTNAEPFGKTTKALYDDALESYVEALDMVMDNPLVRMMRLRQIVTGHIKESDTVAETGCKVKGETYRLNSLKTRYAVELIEANLPKKTVVFYNFTESCASLEAALKKKGIAYLTLNGATKDKSVWMQFQSDDTPVFIAQYQSGARAIDLFAASYTIYYEPTDSSEIMEQSRARTDRNGQTESCAYVMLLTEGSIEEDMYRSLCKHEDFAEESYREIARARVRGA